MARPRAPELSRSILPIPPKAVLLYSIGSSCLHLWLTRVCETVPEPYLDEVFHIPQAQAYWAGSWQTWDPKITTPPGLYIYSYLFAKFFAVFGLRGLGVRQLRTSIEVLLMVMPGVLLRCHPRYYKYQKWSPTLFAQITHANLNIMLCPLLFFFSALYYTDVLSAFVVMEAYRWYVYLGKSQDQSRYPSSKYSVHTLSSMSGVAIFLLGLFAMLVRQTNVFWVAVFLGGLQAVRTLTSCTHPAPSMASQKVPVSVNWTTIYDSPMQNVAVEHYLWTALSLISVAPRHMYRLIGDVLPYLAMLATFTGFVVWNGGVVLGDKENHVASIHLPQMLYIWPCIVFFSWPVLLPSVAKLSRKKLPRLSVALGVMGLMLLAVRFNTIIHPFTLADNRHYVFYVFRILLRHPGVKYAAVPIYFASSWLVIDAWGEVPGIDESKVRRKMKQEGKWQDFSATMSVLEEPTRVSFVLIWLVATTLSLVTAPLVEPRYFIVPWLVWRMNIPVESRRENIYEPSEAGENGFAYQALSWAASNRLWIETAWYLLINVVTCYVFLYKGFLWPQEPDKVQRFMW